MSTHFDDVSKDKDPNDGLPPRFSPARWARLSSHTIVFFEHLATIRALSRFPTFLGRVACELKQQLVSDDIANETYILMVNGALSAMITIALLRNVSSATGDVHVGKLAYPQFSKPVAHRWWYRWPMLDQRPADRLLSKGILGMRKMSLLIGV